MILFDNPASPFCRKTYILIHEVGLLDAVDVRAAVGHPLDSSQMPVDQNPLGKIPTLVREDGQALYDSRVICRYLDAQAGGGHYPADRLWDTLTIEATADGISDAAVAMVYEGRTRPADKQFPEMVEAQWAKITRALDTLEGKWMQHLSGPFDMGHIATISALGYLDFRLSARNWRAGRPTLSDWFESHAARPSVAATKPSAP